MSTSYANDNTEGGAFVIETAETAAGLIILQSEGYRFFAADQRFHLLEGSIFKSPKAAQRAVELMEKAAARDQATARRFADDWHSDNEHPAARDRTRA